MGTPEENKVLADFMGIDFDCKEAYQTYSPPICRSFGRYHKSFDWLMPVLEKIKELGFNTNLFNSSNYTAIYRDETPTERKVCFISNVDCRSTLIESIYSAIYNFICWYNNQPK